MEWFAWMRRCASEEDRVHSSHVHLCGRDQLTEAMVQAEKESARVPWTDRLLARLKRTTLRRNLKRMLDE